MYEQTSPPGKYFSSVKIGASTLQRSYGAKTQGSATYNVNSPSPPLPSPPLPSHSGSRNAWQRRTPSTSMSFRRRCHRRRGNQQKKAAERRRTTPPTITIRTREESRRQRFLPRQPREPRTCTRHSLPRATDTPEAVA